MELKIKIDKKLFITFASKEMDPDQKIDYILIDMSYFIFYRYFALVRWWKHAKPDNPLDLTKIGENKEFVEKFEKTFQDKIKEVPKKLKLKRVKYMIGKDCGREKIWRNDICGFYKANRVNDDEFMVGIFFEKAYKILEKEKMAILYHPKLEADDCIALTTKYLLSKNENNFIYIIANDMDYLQLIQEKVMIINLKYKNLAENKNWSGNGEKDLFCKIVMGDKSDNIPSIFEKCGPKTALKCYEDKEYFKRKLENEEISSHFLKNKRLIDFNEIPEELKIEFLEFLNSTLSSPH